MTAEEFLQNKGMDTDSLLCYDSPENYWNVVDLMEEYAGSLETSAGKVYTQSELDTMYHYLISFYFRSQQNGLIEIDTNERLKLEKLLKIK